jgi:heat shock protein HslJ
MKFCKFSTLVFPIVFILVTACSSTREGIVADKPSHSSASRALTENALNNAAYQIDEVGLFNLDNGVFNQSYGESMTQRHQVTLEKVAFGDLDDDGLGDAAVILARQSGGSGTFRYLVAMRNTGNSPRQQDSVFLGDRVQIIALSIAADQVNLEAVAASPHDPACCPAQQVKQAYILRDGKWAQSVDKIADSDPPIASSSTITGIVWKWGRFEGSSNKSNFVIDDPNKYTLMLLPNGSYQAKADCNRMQGQYTLEGRRIKIMPGAATLAECAPGSRYADYLRHLTEAVSFVVRDNKLVLSLVVDGGNLVSSMAAKFPKVANIRPKANIAVMLNPLK